MTKPKLPIVVATKVVITEDITVIGLVDHSVVEGGVIKGAIGIPRDAPMEVIYMCQLRAFQIEIRDSPRHQPSQKRHLLLYWVEFRAVIRV